MKRKMTKAELRVKYLRVREQIANREAKDQAIFERVARELTVQQAKMVLLYASYRGEVDTWRLIEYLLSDGRKKVALPRVEGRDLTFCVIDDISELKKGKFGILEPKNAKSKVLVLNNDNFGVLGAQNGPKIEQYDKTVCLVPGVCFNKQGYRIGYGGGFYDRFLAKNDIYSIGLCYRECLTEMEFQDRFDEKVDKVITD